MTSNSFPDHVHLDQPDDVRVANPFHEFQTAHLGPNPLTRLPAGSNVTVEELDRPATRWASCLPDFPECSPAASLQESASLERHAPRSDFVHDPGRDELADGELWEARPGSTRSSTSVERSDLQVPGAGRVCPPGTTSSGGVSWPLCVVFFPRVYQLFEQLVVGHRADLGPVAEQDADRENKPYTSLRTSVGERTREGR